MNIKGQGAGRGSSIGSVSAWHASGSEFDPHVRHIREERFSTAILPLPLIQGIRVVSALGCFGRVVSAWVVSANVLGGLFRPK